MIVELVCIIYVFIVWALITLNYDIWADTLRELLMPTKIIYPSKNFAKMINVHKNLWIIIVLIIRSMAITVTIDWMDIIDNDIISIIPFRFALEFADQLCKKWFANSTVNKRYINIV